MLTLIEIQNFRSCRSTNLVFRRGVSALVGKNGVGKTNILQCIEWLANMSRPSGLITVETANPDEPGLSVRASLNLDGTELHYSFEAPSIRNHVSVHKGQFFVDEKLVERRARKKPVEVFSRKGEEVKVNGRESPIRISSLAWSIGALSALLPAGDPVRHVLEPISTFFSGISYYSLEERPDAMNLIPERAYSEWAQGVRDGHAVTDSVGLRLIYMMKEDRAMFAEFQSLIGPAGIDLVNRIEIANFSSTQVNGQSGPTHAPEYGSYFYPTFEPPAHMGGAGSLFPFSQLSEGSRRAIRAVTALLFDKRSLILMEHPENSIHPGLLRKMIDLFRSYSDRSQIVFTTHSPEVLDILDPEEVLLVTAPKGITTARSLARDEISMARRFLNEEGSLSEFVETLDE